jgi:glucose-1-phosphate cytidylyltransferase
LKTVILAGGLGTRISEESSVRPKPMVEIGGRPILWHIMKIYSAHGIDEFVILAGYKGHIIREYFANYALNSSDVMFDLATGECVVHASSAEPWKVSILDTGLEPNTGGRLRLARDHIGDETFCLSYGDCVSNVDITAEIAAHRASNALATLTAIQPPGRFGVLELGEGSQVKSFREKPHGESWVNGGFFVVEPEALDYITSDDQQWEREPLERVSQEGRLHAFKHLGHWQNLDSLRDRNELESQWSRGPEWKIW